VEELRIRSPADDSRHVRERPASQGRYGFRNPFPPTVKVMSMSAELYTYKDMVDDAMRRSRETGKPVVFENEGPGHARIVIDSMLENSAKTLAVVAGQLDNAVWSARSIANFLTAHPEATVQVILDECNGDRVPANSALLGLSPTDQSRVQIRRLPWQLEGHFFVADEQHVRLEYNKQTQEASITFGDPTGAGKSASELFSAIWQLAKPCPIQLSELHS
jgi:hypothetical protein